MFARRRIIVRSAGLCFGTGILRSRLISTTPRFWITGWVLSCALAPDVETPAGVWWQQAFVADLYLGPISGGSLGIPCPVLSPMKMTCPASTEIPPLRQGLDKRHWMIRCIPLDGPLLRHRNRLLLLPSRDHYLGCETGRSFRTVPLLFADLECLVSNVSRTGTQRMPSCCWLTRTSLESSGTSNTSADQSPGR